MEKKFAISRVKFSDDQPNYLYYQRYMLILPHLSSVFQHIFSFFPYIQQNTKNEPKFMQNNKKMDKFVKTSSENAEEMIVQIEL